MTAEKFKFLNYKLSLVNDIFKSFKEFIFTTIYLPTSIKFHNNNIMWS